MYTPAVPYFFQPPTLVPRSRSSFPPYRKHGNYELDGLLQSNPVCLCQLLAGGADTYGISVDYKRAMALPGVCRLNAPPLSACAAFGVPVGPSSAPLTGVSPSATGPQMPENPPSGTPSKSKSDAPGRLTAHGLVALAALPLAITAAAMF